MELPAYKDLLNDSQNLELIKTYVDNILSTIYKYISQAMEHISGGKIIVPLPSTFNIPLHAPADARRKVYYYVIVALENKGYKDKFYLTRGRNNRYVMVFDIKHEIRPERKNYIDEKISQYIKNNNNI